jgi:glycosyltransferase involved in cell wall biosynthesis
VRVTRAALAMKAAGCAVTVVDIEHDASKPAREVIEGVEFRHIHMAKGLARYYQPVNFIGWIVFKAWRILLSILKVSATPADVYHAHDVTALPACYVAARARRKPLLYDAHELPLVDPHQTRHRLVWRISVFLLRRMAARCTAIITVSPPLVQEFNRRYGGPLPAVVRNIPPYQPAPMSDRLRRALDVPEDGGVALYQGLLQEDRGLDGLIFAARYMAPRHRLALMGRDLTQGALATLVEREGVGDRVKILPPVPYEELLAWTASADLGLIIYRPSHSPNVRYCLPNKIFEYLMAGVPILASPLDAVSDLLHYYGVGRIVPSLEPAVVGSAINQLLDDNAARWRMRDNALRASHQDLCWERESARLVAVYSGLIGRATSRRGARVASKS